MNYIPINRTKNDLLYHFRCIRHIEYVRLRFIYSRPIIFGLVYSFVVSMVFFFTDKNEMVAFKGVSFVLLTFSWTFLIAFSVWQAVKNLKIYLRFNRMLSAALDDRKNYFMDFNQEMLVYGSEDYTMEAKWTYFIGYLEVLRPFSFLRKAR